MNNYYFTDTDFQIWPIWSNYYLIVSRKRPTVITYMSQIVFTFIYEAHP